MNAADLMKSSPLLGGLAAVALAAALTGLAMSGDPQAELVVALVAGATAGALVTLPSVTGRIYSLAVAGAVALPGVLMTDDLVIRLRPAATAVVMGVAGSHLVPLLRGADLRRVIRSTLRYLVMTGVVVLVFAAAARQVWPYVAPDRAQASAYASGAGAIAWFVLHLLLPADDGSRYRNFLQQVVDRCSEWPPAVTVLATGGFFGVLWQAMPWWWATAVVAVPYTFAHVGFGLSHRTSGTYRATVEALSRVPEVAGLTPNGHGGRTAILAREIAEELGMLAAERIELERAALLHDIGRLALSQPTILRRGFSEEDIARWGSEMIREAPTLQKAATLVAHQHEPYRRPGESFDPELPLGSKIIRVASAYDHATTELGFLPLEALELLHQGAAYDYDPEIVSAVRTVLERRGAI